MKTERNERRHLAEKRWFYAVALSTNLAVFIVQAYVYREMASSIALLGDAFHSFSDIIVLLGVIVLTTFLIAHPTHHAHMRIDRVFTRCAIILLWLSALYVMWEGAWRLIAPVPFPGLTVVGVSLFAMFGNFFAHYVLERTHASVQDTKHRASVAHVLTDAILSLVVLVSAFFTFVFNAPAIDGIGAIIIGCGMFVIGYKLWREIGKEHPHHHAH